MKMFIMMILAAGFLAQVSNACEVDSDCGADSGWTCIMPYHPGDSFDNSRCSYSGPAGSVKSIQFDEKLRAAANFCEAGQTTCYSYCSDEQLACGCTNFYGGRCPLAAECDCPN